MNCWLLTLVVGASLLVITAGQSNDVKNLRRCSLKQKQGPCKAKIRQWSFDRTRNQCVEFFFGGCRGNRNRFESLAKCERKCKDKFPRCPLPGLIQAPEGCKYVEERKPPSYCPSFRVQCPAIRDCSLPADSGPCEADMSRYRFNRQTNRCELFSYGGCQGNENRFETIRACERKCKGKFPQCPVFRLTSPPEGCEWKFDVKAPEYCRSPRLDCPLKQKCSLKQDPGPCRRSVPSFYFDRTTDSCKKFIFGGCLGNENRFSTFEECQGNCAGKFDRCPLPRMSPAPEGCSYVEERNAPEYCPTFRLSCPPIRQCSLPAEPGLCKAAFPKYYFDRKTNRCEKFTYGGCGGNDNRFDTLEECQSTCANKFPQCPVPGLLPPKEGCTYEDEIKPPGYCPMPKETCPPFDPNVECRRAPAEGFLCRGNVQRYAYSPSTGRCSPFAYGGCAGNRNNFNTQQECEQACSGI